MRSFLLFAFFLLVFTYSNGQDQINKKNGEIINAKVLEVNTDNVKYKKSDKQDGPLYTVEKKDLIGITYANGDEDVFKIESKADKKMFIWSPMIKKMDIPKLAKGAKIQIIDNRKQPPAKSKVEFTSSELVSLLGAILKSENASQIELLEDNITSPDVKISIEAYDAVFYPGAWHTQTRYLITVYKDGKPSFKEIESLKGAFNTFGVSTAKSRLTKSFEDATSQMVNYLNEKL